jgi:hypothetical protein
MVAESRNRRTHEGAIALPPNHAVSERRRRGALRVAATIAAAAGGVVLIAGCGGAGSNPGVANVSSSETSTSQPSSTPSSSGGSALGGDAPSTPSGGGQSSSLTIAGGNRQNALKYSACMRTNGEPNFPDPNAQGVIQFGSSDGIDPRSAAFQKAQQKCAQHQGGGHAPSPAQQAKAQAAALKFSQCMRSHGEPDFPDPQFSSGGISIKISAPGSGGSSALDPNSPIFQRAQRACRSFVAAR